MKFRSLITDYPIRFLSLFSFHTLLHLHLSLSLLYSTSPPTQSVRGDWVGGWGGSITNLLQCDWSRASQWGPFSCRGWWKSLIVDLNKQQALHSWLWLKGMIRRKGLNWLCWATRTNWRGNWSMGGLWISLCHMKYFTPYWSVLMTLEFI